MAQNAPKRSINLADFLPLHLRNETNESILKNLFNKYFSKDRSIQQIGFVGADLGSVGDNYIGQPNLDREINALQPAMHLIHGDEEEVFTLNDTLHKLKLLGVDVSKFSEWGQAQGYNLYLPIDLDKFCNYNSYYWYGHLLSKATTPGTFQNGAWTTALTRDYNVDVDPDYIVMDQTAATDWSYDNYWIHIDDVANVPGIALGDMVQARRPIIEYAPGLELNNKISSSGAPVGPLDVGIEYTQSKTARSQYPMFNLYKYDGTHANKIGSILSYVEGSVYEEDDAIGLRIAKDKYGDYTFSHSLADSTGRLYFYKQGASTFSLWRKSAIAIPRYVIKSTDGALVDINPATDVDGVGAWMTPEQLVKNINHENRKSINYGDLSNHFVSIMTSQVGFSGNPHGSNTFRGLSVIDAGLGGIIKDYDTSFGMFMGIVNQQETSPISMIDFLPSQYDQALTFVREYISQNIGEFVTSGTFNPTPSKVVASYETLQGLIKDSLRTRSVNDIFIDSTSPIPGFPITLPYMGLAAKVKPDIVLDGTTGNYVLVHHDGHKSAMVSISNTLLSGIANVQYNRGGTMVAGHTGINPPARPYRNQFWYNPATGLLKAYAVNSDTGVPLYPVFTGDYVYNRSTGVLATYNASTDSLIPVADPAAAWETVDVAAITNIALLQLENELYDNVPVSQTRIDIAAVEAAHPTEFIELMEKELIKYASKFGLDPYITDYDPRDPFTWNYSQADFNGDATPDGIARWHTLYEQYYSTTRPNLEPWKLVGHTTKPSTWDAAYADTSGSRMWSDVMWSDVKGLTVPADPSLIVTPWTGKLSVNTSTDALLPPYISAADPLSADAFITSIPAMIDARYTFGDNGPIELQWKSSASYLHDTLKTVFRLSPVEFITKTWGDNDITSADDYVINRHYGKKLGHHEIILHGEAVTTPSNNLVVQDFRIVGTDNIYGTDLPFQTFTLKVIASTPTGQVIDVRGSITGKMPHAYVNQDYSSNGMTFKVIDDSFDAIIGDKFIVEYTAFGIWNITFVPATYYSYVGFNQIYSQLNRYNSVDTSIAKETGILRDWDAKLIYRVSGMLDTNSLIVQTDDYFINKDDISIILKENLGIEDYWLNALRIQLVRRGEHVESGVYHQRSEAGNFAVPANKGADWEYRVEIFNSDNPSITYYDMNQAGRYHTFRALSGENSIDTWTVPLDKGALVTMSTPFVITGIQNVANMLYGYLEKLKEDGWRFNKDRTPQIDSETGRALNWQLEIEKFIDAQFKGMIPGKAVIINPFIKSVWFETPHGVVSSLKKKSFADVYSTQTIFNAAGKAIDHSQIRIFRTDEETEIVSQEPIAGIHLILDEYEQVLVFENYIASRTDRDQLMFDSFLGTQIVRLHLQADIQDDFTGKVSYGGHYLVGSEVRKNIESSLDTLTNMYDSTKMSEGHPATKSARGLLGYRRLPYLDTMGIPDKSQFGFWKAMIHNKGSNSSVSAFLNSARFENAEIDEFWAYKIAEYGDGRTHDYPEIRLNTNDVEDRWVKMQFIDPAFPDVSVQPGVIAVADSDYSRWYSIDDNNSDMHFIAELLGTVLVEYPAVTNGTLVSLTKGAHEIIADAVEVFKEETSLVDGVTVTTTKLTAGTDYEIVNKTTIKILTGDPSLMLRYVIKCYGPAFDRYNPCKLIDYANNVIVQDVVMWDPRRGAHSSQAKSIVDITSSQDPAKYNFSTRVVGNVNFDPLRPWGKNEVGRVWWDTKNLSYTPYNDENIFIDEATRLARWGSLADWSSVDLYEWTESKVHPSEYDKLVSEQEGDADISPEVKASGTPSRKELYTRDRTWRRRPVAWAKNGAALSHLTGHDVTITTGGYALVSDVSWDSIGISKGMKLSNYTGLVLDGEALVTADPVAQVVIGTPLSDASLYFTGITVEPLNNGINLPGQIKVEWTTISGEKYLKATLQDAVTLMNISQVVKITDPIDSVGETGSVVIYDFTDLGFKVSCTTVFAWEGLLTSAERIDAIAAAFVVPFANLVVLKSAVAVDVLVNFTGSVNSTTGLPQNVTFTDCAYWTDPTKEEYLDDLAAPHNIWTPTYGAYSSITKLSSNIKDIQSELSSPMVNRSGEVVTRYDHVWGTWSLISPTIKSVKYATVADATFVFDATLDISAARVYVNGISLESKSFTISGSTVYVNSSFTVNEGEVITVIIPVPTIPKAKLDFDPVKKDDPSVLTQYKYDYQYTVHETYNEFGQVLDKKYYFWVSGKSIATRGRQLSLLAAADQLHHMDRPYGIMTNIVDATADRPIHYTQYLASGLNRYVKKDDTYKLRFTRDFTLRDDPNGINLKNIHTEWILLRESQSTRIPKELWERLIDAACGQDIAGNNVPSSERVNYDSIYGTNTKYGFEKGQALVDTALAVESIKYAILNTKVTSKNYAAGVGDSIQPIEFLDYSKSEEWFLTPESTRKILTDIWDRAMPEHVNEIFFNVFHDALSKNYEFKNIIKTSMISAHTIRFFDSKKVV